MELLQHHLVLLMATQKKITFLSLSVWLYTSGFLSSLFGHCGGLLVKALDCRLKGPGFLSHLQRRFFFSSGYTQPYLQNWVESFSLRPSKGTLSCQSLEPLKISLLVNWVIPGKLVKTRLIKGTQAQSGWLGGCFFAICKVEKAHC